jgi:integrase
VPRLTEKLISKLTLEPRQKDRLLFDTVCRGLGVRLTAKGTRTFLVQWTDPATHRKVREPLGVWGGISLEQARAAAQARFGAVAKGIDVKAERDRRREQAERDRAEATLSLRALIEEWSALHLVHRRPRYAAEARRALYHTFEHLLNRPATRINRADAVNALDALARAGKAAMASRTMAYARACYRWAQKRGKVPANPFQDLPITAGATERDRVLTDAELAAVWQATDGIPYPFGRFFKLLILTLQRREEVAGMRWSEISADLTTWTVPANRMKNGRAHDVHLSEAARAVLRSMPRVEGQDLVHTTTGRTPVSGISKAKRRLDAMVIAAQTEAAAKARTKPAALVPWRLHDLRRTGVSKLAALGFDSIVADKLLAHKPAKLRGVAAVYQRYDFANERSRALDAWAAHVQSCVDETSEHGARSNGMRAPLPTETFSSRRRN